MKNITMTLLICLSTVIFSQTAVPPSSGDGTIGNPYQISTLDNLYWITSDTSNWDKHFIQTADINAASTATWFPDGSGGFYGWKPISNNTVKFTGSYNGQNYNIGGLYINREKTTDSYIGMFGYTDTGSFVTNLSLTNVNIDGYYYVGALVGLNKGTITNCHASGSMAGNSYLGGLAGCNYGLIQLCSSAAQVNGYGYNYAGGLIGDNHTGTVNGCSASGDVNGAYEIGGLVGTNYSGTIANSYSTGSVTSTNDRVGGLVGTNYRSSVTPVIRNCFTSAPSVQGDNDVGGLAGYSYGEIINSWYDNSEGTVSSVYGWDIGGLVGYNNGIYAVITGCHSNAFVIVGSGGGSIGGLTGVNSGTINTSYSTGDVTGEDDIGGFVGDNYGGDIIGNENNYCYSTGAVTGRDYAGAFAGTSYNSATMEYCYSTGQVTARNYVGGLTGYLVGTSTLEHSYSEGDVSGNEKVGGAVGYAYSGSSITSCYSNSNVTSTGKWTGGLTGTLSGADWASRSYITDSYSSGIVSCPASVTIIGGLTGYCYGTIVRSYAAGAVNAPNCNYVGGFAGANEGEINTSYSSGSVTGSYEVGGFAGYSYSSTAFIENCYAVGNVTGNNEVGAFAGWNSEELYKSYASGHVTGSTNTAAFAGFDDGNGSYIACFVDTENGGITSDLVGNIADPVEVSGKTTAEMKTQTTFTGWDFSSPVWNIHPTLNGGYPYLEWQGLVPSDVFAGGDGTSGNPYQVATADHLNQVRNYLDAYFIQTADIDLGVDPWNAGTGWVPIGNNPNYFTGNYNGNDFSISNLTFNDISKYYVGLFGWVQYATLKNINLADVDINSSEYTGALVGQCVYESTISKCSASGSVATDSGYAGGLAGNVYSDCIVSQCYSTCSVTSRDYYVGGLIGCLQSASLSDSYALGAVSTNDGAGGLLGGNRSLSTVTNCYSAGSVSSAGDKGGLIAWNYLSTTTNCFWDTQTSGQTTSDGPETGKTTEEMKMKTTFTDAGWDFTDIWGMDGTNNNGYPYLHWQFPAPDTPEGVTIVYTAADPVLSWTAVSGATSYKVYSSTNPYAPFPTGWTLRASGITGLNWTDTIATETKKFYIVVAVN